MKAIASKRPAMRPRLATIGRVRRFIVVWATALCAPIAAGGVWSASLLAEDASYAASHWAFRPLVRPALPAVEHAEAARTEIDCFVQARLEKLGLSLGPDADAAALVRRVALDATGLPPTPEDVERFVADPSEAAYVQLVERYLASPSYGERWGKHWLDAAGYADSNGYFSADTDRPLAYRYRDYVIRSLCADKPFDRFVCEQLAGDEMAKFRPGPVTTPEVVELLEATHFLRNGQDGTDIGVKEPEAFEIDRRAALEAAVQVVASSLWGLTVHCARCHDHKLEPISQSEYYQLQAVLFPAFNPQDWTNPEDRVVYAHLPGEQRVWAATQRDVHQELERLATAYRSWLDENREPSELVFREDFTDANWVERWSNRAPGDDRDGGTVHVGGDAPNGACVVNSALQILSGPHDAWLSTKQAVDWTPDVSGGWIQATFRLVDDKPTGAPAERIGYVLAVHDFDDSSARAAGNLLVDGYPASATSVYLDYPGADQKAIGSLGKQGYAPGREYGVRVTNVGDNSYRLEHLWDGMTDGAALDLAAADLPDGGFAFYYCCGRSYVVDDVRIERSASPGASPGAPNPRLAALRASREARRKTYDEQRAALERRLSPQPGRAIAWTTDKSARPPEVPFLERGMYHLRGALVEPGALQALTDVGAEYVPLPPGGDLPMTGRRLGLARWLTRPGSRPAALLARVHVNRIWRQYFGRGIVATTDNLGASGARPTHPELLEWLAGYLVQHGWSQKALHRRILLSSVYRQSSAPRVEGLSIDPENTNLWRWPVRRLEAEVLRDAMLCVAGDIDVTLGGPYVPTEQSPVGEVVVDEKSPGAHRRSVYLQQRRSQTLSMLKVFDAPAISTICTSRVSSTVPLQSLALLNSEFAVARGEALARRLLRETDGTTSQLVRRAWRTAIGRDPSANEQALAARFLADQQGQYAGDQAASLALADFCQMVLASNAFLYVQ